jgi:hypothetical protein
MVFDTNTLTMTGYYNGPKLKIIGTAAVLTQNLASLACNTFSGENGSRTLENVLVAGDFTSLGDSAIRGTGIRSIIFYKDIKITTATGNFTLAYNDLLVTLVDFTVVPTSGHAIILYFTPTSNSGSCYNTVFYPNFG